MVIIGCYSIYKCNKIIISKVINMNYEIRKMIGQKFILGLDANINDDIIKTLIQKYKIGGFILYKKNYQNYSSMLNFIKKLKSYNKMNDTPLFISIDQEGGRVDRLPKEIKNTPPAFKLSKSNNPMINIKKSAELVNKILVESGINMNFAPVLDIKRFEDGHAIGDRSFGENAKEVSKYALEYFKHLNNNLISVIKHFPGHGAIQKDSHYFLPVVRNYKTLEEDIQPFLKAIKDGCDAIMVGHILIKDINWLYPIAFDKNFLLKKLRKEVNYDGLLITDELKMKGIYYRYNIMKLIKNAFQGEIDIILMKYTNDLSKFEKLFKLYNNNILDIEKLKTSYQRIINIKNKYNLNDNTNYNGINIENYNKEIIELLNECK